MGPIVPILRLAYLFLNIYDTYKVLKGPVPSARSGGQPSVRAMTQRKRDMKGIMTIWTVWVCLRPSSRVSLPLAHPDRPRFPLWTVLHSDIRKHGRPAHNLLPLLRRNQIRLPPLLYLHSSPCEYIHFHLSLGRSRLALGEFEPSTPIQLDRGTLRSEHVSLLIGCRTGLSSRNPTLD